MTDFKEYSDEQLISQFKLLLEEIKERELGLKLYKEIKYNDYILELSSLIVCNSAVEENEGENPAIGSFFVYLTEKSEEFADRHDMDL